MPKSTPRGAELLANPLLNRGTAFTNAERAALGLHGLLPPQVETLAQQARRAWEAYLRKDDDLERHIYLRALQDNNEVLFHRLLHDHIAATMPIVYTPVVAEACRQFSHIYRRPRGLILSYPWRHALRRLLRNRPHAAIDVIVATDGERVLGIGDQGIGGLGISIGKLALYTLIGGIHPGRTLPVVLDVGTNNPELLRDPEYLGWRHERLTGRQYEAFIASFVEAVRAEMPCACLQWEDFASHHAQDLLTRYRDRILSFNDDIQGTAAVTLAAAAAAIAAAGSRFREQRWVFFGAGATALGVADYLRAAMVGDGLDPAAARAAFWFVDSAGLVHAGRRDLSAAKRAYAQPRERLAGWKRRAEAGPIRLLEVVRQVRPTGLIGLSTVPGAFDETVVTAMARHAPRPIIFPLSNPTACSEARPEDLLRWSQGRALVATGSPFAGVAQCNNVYIFPAVGLGAVGSGARRITDTMMMAAGHALARHSPALKHSDGPLLPDLKDLRRVALDVAVAVATVADASLQPELRARLRAFRWAPVYTTTTTAEP